MEEELQILGVVLLLMGSLRSSSEGADPAETGGADFEAEAAAAAAAEAEALAEEQARQLAAGSPTEAGAEAEPGAGDPNRGAGPRSAAELAGARIGRDAPMDPADPHSAFPEWSLHVEPTPTRRLTAAEELAAQPISLTRALGGAILKPDRAAAAEDPPAMPEPVAPVMKVRPGSGAPTPPRRAEEPDPDAETDAEAASAPPRLPVALAPKDSWVPEHLVAPDTPEPEAPQRTEQAAEPPQAEDSTDADASEPSPELAPPFDDPPADDPPSERSLFAGMPGNRPPADDVERTWVPIDRGLVGNEIAPRGATGRAAWRVHLVNSLRSLPGRQQETLENFVGGSVLLVTGLVAVLFAGAFFLKAAIEEGRLTPMWRITLEASAGLALLAFGEQVRRRRNDLVGQALQGLGFGVLCISTYFVVLTYDVLDDTAAWVAIGALTALVAGCATWKKAPLMAWMGYAGGFVAPALIGTGPAGPGSNAGAFAALTAWLVCLDLSLVPVLTRRAWRGFEVLALLGTAGHIGAWFAIHGGETSGLTLPLLALLGSVLLVCVAPSVLGRRRLPKLSLVTAASAGVLALAGTHVVAGGDRVVLGVGTLGVGSCLAFGGWIAERVRGRRDEDSRSLYLCGLGALGLAVPILLEGRLIAPMWAFTGLTAVQVGQAHGLRDFVKSGLVFVGLSVVFGMLADLPLPKDAGAAFWNLSLLGVLIPPVTLLGVQVQVGLLDPDRSRRARSMVRLAAVWCLATIAAFEVFRITAGQADVQTARSAGALALAGVAVLLAFPARRALFGGVPALVPLTAAMLVAAFGSATGHEQAFVPGFNAVFIRGLLVVLAGFITASLCRERSQAYAVLAGLFLLLVLVTNELHAFGEFGPLVDGSREAARSRAQVCISVAWALEGAVLIAWGFLLRRSEVRWAGMIIFLLTVGKVFLLDMAKLDTSARVGSFLVLGLMLVGASVLYQRRLKRPAVAEQRPG